MYKIEICANSVTSCLEAQSGGAHRVELCAAIPEGGTTPSYGEIVLAREKLHIALNVIIRPGPAIFCIPKSNTKPCFGILKCAGSWELTELYLAA